MRVMVIVVDFVARWGVNLVILRVVVSQRWRRWQRVSGQMGKWRRSIVESVMSLFVVSRSSIDDVVRMRRRRLGHVVQGRVGRWVGRGRVAVRHCASSHGADDRLG